MQFPKGISLEDDEGNSSIIVLLRKALYGLRQSQSPQLFNKLLNELLTKVADSSASNRRLAYISTTTPMVGFLSGVKLIISS